MIIVKENYFLNKCIKNYFFRTTFGVLLGISLIFLVAPTKVFSDSIKTRPATESEVNTIRKTDIGFSVEPLYGERQRENNVNYWSLIVRPNQVVKLTLKIVNGDKNHEFDIGVNTAVTNSNLTVDYSKTPSAAKKMLSGDVPIDFPKSSNIASSGHSAKRILVAKDTVATIPIEVSIPSNRFKGQSVGGVSVTRLATDNESKQTISNLYNYTYAIVMAENNKPVTPNVEFVSLSGRAQKFNNTVKVKIKNSSNAIVSGVSVNGAVTNNTGKQVAKLIMKNGTISPLADFDLVFRNNDVQWPAGKYHVKLVMMDKENNQWRVNQEITIKKNKKLTIDNVKKNKVQNKQGLIFTLIVIILSLIIIGLFAYFKILRNRQDD